MKRAKLLAHDWSSDCLATAYAIEKLLLKISVTMASRFEIVDEEYIKELKDKSENENTRKSTEYWKNVFKKWANERNFQANLEECESDERLLKSAFRNSVISPSHLCFQKLLKFQQLLKTRVILILNFTRPHAITYANNDYFMLFDPP